MSLNNMPRPAQQQRTEKVLACVNCQHRKKKCDRASPCSLCIKLDVPCTPSTPAPRRKRRRKTREMIDRLERCEALLMQWVASDGCARTSRVSPSESGSATTTTTTAVSAESPGSTTTTATTTSVPSPPPCSYAKYTDIQKHFKACPAAEKIKNKLSATTSSMLSDLQLRPGVIRSIEGPDSMDEIYSHRPLRSPTSS